MYLEKRIFFYNGRQHSSTFFTIVNDVFNQDTEPKNRRRKWSSTGRGHFRDYRFQICQHIAVIRKALGMTKVAPADNTDQEEMVR